MFPLALLAAGIPAIAQGITGLIQGAKAKKINPERPEMKVPGSVTAATNIAKNQLNADLGINKAIGQSAAQNANLFRSAMDTGSPIKALAALNAANQSTNNLISQQADMARNFKLNANNVLMGQLGRQGAYEQQAWDWNKRQPYLDAMATKSALQEAGMRNRMGALSAIGSIGASFLPLPGQGQGQQQGFDVNQLNQMSGFKFPMPTSPNQYGDMPGIGPFNNPFFGG